MKKLSIVLLILAMAGGFAFADDFALSGDATFSVSYDLDNAAGGFDALNDATAVELDFTLVPGASASAMGEGDLYAELGVSVTGITIDETLTLAGAALTLDTFKIHAGDITVDLTGSSLSGFASYDWDADDTLDATDAAVVGVTGKNGGIGIEANGISLGLDFWYDDAATPKTVYLISGGYEMDLAEGVTAAVVAGLDADGVDVGAQVAYAADDYDATVNFDFVDSGAFDVELEASATIDIVTSVLDVYFDGTDVWASLVNDIDLDPIALGVDLGIVETDAITIDADVTTSVEAATIVVDGGVVLATGAMTGWDAGAKVTYALDSADVYVDANLTSAATVLGLALEAGMTSGSLINGATTSLIWASGDLLAATPVLGTITAAVKVSL